MKTKLTLPERIQMALDTIALCEKQIKKIDELSDALRKSQKHCKRLREFSRDIWGKYCGEN